MQLVPHTPHKRAQTFTHTPSETLQPALAEVPESLGVKGKNDVGLIRVVALLTITPKSITDLVNLSIP